MTLPNDNVIFLGSIEVNQSDCPPSCFTKQAKNVMIMLEHPSSFQCLLLLQFYVATARVLHFLLLAFRIVDILKTKCHYHLYKGWDSNPHQPHVSHPI